MAKQVIPTLGFNVGHSNENQFSASAWDLLLDVLEFKHGCKRIRMNAPAYTFPTTAGGLFDEMWQRIQEALDREFYVIWTTTANGSGVPLTSAMYTSGAYMTRLQLICTMAEALTYTGDAMLELQTGNEEEDNLAGGYTTSQFRLDTRTTVADAMKAIYTKGPITYTTFDTQWTAWAADGLGSLDGFGGNIYRNRHFYLHSEKQSALYVLLNAFPGKNRFNQHKVAFTEVQSLDQGLNDTGFNKGKEMPTMFDIVHRYEIIKDLAPNSAYYYFAFDAGFSTNDNWDYKINPTILGGTKAGHYRKWREYFENQGRLFVHGEKDYWNQQNLISNNRFHQDVSYFNTANGCTITRVTSGGPVTGGTYAKVKSTSDGLSRVFTNTTIGPSNGNLNMIIRPWMVGMPIYLSWWARYDPADIPTGSGRADLRLSQSSGSIISLQNSLAFTPGNAWTQYFFLFKCTQSCYLTLELWGKQPFTSAVGTVHYSGLVMSPLPNDQIELPLEFMNRETKYCVPMVDAPGSGQVDGYRWMPPARLLYQGDREIYTENSIIEDGELLI